VSFQPTWAGNRGGVRGRSAVGLLALPIEHQGIELGRAVDVLLDLEAGLALGIEVHCGDGTRRFLALGAARIGGDAVEISSPLAFLDDAEFYRRRGSSLRALRGTPVADRDRGGGLLLDALLSETWSIAGFLVETEAGVMRVPFGPGVKLGRERKVPAG
jgi:hypothetical protein